MWLLCTDSTLSTPLHPHLIGFHDFVFLCRCFLSMCSPCPHSSAQASILTPVPQHQHCASFVFYQSRILAPAICRDYFPPHHVILFPKAFGHFFFLDVEVVTFFQSFHDALQYGVRQLQELLFLISSRGAGPSTFQQIYHNTLYWSGNTASGIISVTVLVNPILPEMGKQRMMMKYFLQKCAKTPGEDSVRPWEREFLVQNASSFLQVFTKHLMRV